MTRRCVAVQLLAPLPHLCVSRYYRHVTLSPKHDLLHFLLYRNPHNISFLRCNESRPSLFMHSSLFCWNNSRVPPPLLPKELHYSPLLGCSFSHSMGRPAARLSRDFPAKEWLKIWTAMIYSGMLPEILGPMKSSHSTHHHNFYKGITVTRSDSWFRSLEEK